MVTWHLQHPTREHSCLATEEHTSYSVTAPKVYNPCGLCQYCEKEPEKREIVAAGNLVTDGQIAMYKKLTKNELNNKRDESSEDAADINS